MDENYNYLESLSIYELINGDSKEFLKEFLGDIDSPRDDESLKNDSPTTVERIREILKKDLITVEDEKNIIIFLINRECKRENIPVPEIEFPLSVSANCDDKYLGTYSNGVIQMGVFTNLEVSMLSMVVTAMHELCHYFAEYEAKTGKFTSRAYHHVKTKLLRDEFSKTDFDEYRINYGTKESEMDAEKYAFRKVCEFARDFGNEKFNKKNNIEKYQYKLLAEYLKETKARAIDIDGNFKTLYNYNIDALKRILEKNPEYIEKYPLLNRMFEISPSGHVIIGLTRVATLKNDVNEAFYAGGISQKEKEENDSICDEIINYAMNDDKIIPALERFSDESQKNVFEACYDTFFNNCERINELFYYASNENQPASLHDATMALLNYSKSLINIENFACILNEKGIINDQQGINIQKMSQNVVDICERYQDLYESISPILPEENKDMYDEFFKYTKEMAIKKKQEFSASQK